MTEQTARRGPGRPRKSNAPAITQVSPRQPEGPEAMIVTGWRATWSTKGRIAPETTATLPSEEAARIVEKGLARYA